MSIILAIGGWHAESDPIRSSHLLINPGANINRTLQPHFLAMGKKICNDFGRCGQRQLTSDLPKILSLLQQCRPTQTLINKISQAW